MDHALRLSSSLGPCLRAAPSARCLRSLVIRAPPPPRASSGDADPSPDYVHPKDRAFKELRDWEAANPAYRREDLSEEHARAARTAFLAAIAPGDAAMDMAEAALQIAAEDDALVSHGAVAFPVASFRQRLQRLADELARVTLPPLRAAGASDQDLLDAVLGFVYVEKKFASPPSGRSVLLGVPVRVDAPGVWEDARRAYLTDTLITRKGIPGVLAVLLGDLLRRLLIDGAIDFVARVELADLNSPPSVTIIPGITRAMALGGGRGGGGGGGNDSDGLVLNMCSGDALAECLSYLKRAYWPFPWDGRRGGFAGAAAAFLDGAESAEAEAIARTARHRLERGIWTSPGAGDLRRALAAAERLAILRGAPEDRRDLAALYCHAGRLREAQAELKAYAVARAAGDGERGPRRGGPPPRQGLAPGPGFALSLSPVGVSVAASAEDLPEAVLADRLLALLAQVAPLGGGPAAAAALDAAEAARRCAQAGPPRVLPLTW